tara:strand:+ start:97 stop:309 length:213 start_codon:yes stop_codon:yes gene_type:complete
VLVVAVELLGLQHQVQKVEIASSMELLQQAAAAEQENRETVLQIARAAVAAEAEATEAEAGLAYRYLCRI